jgi:hypothetical protein
MVRSLSWDHPLPPLLFCRAVTDSLGAGFTQSLHEALQCFEDDQRPCLVELRQERESALTFDPEDRVLPPLGELEPSEVFRTLCMARGRDDIEVLDAAFGSLAGATEDDFQAMLEDVRTPR